MSLTMKNLEKCFIKSKEQWKEYVGVKIQMQDFQKPEIIINPRENFDAKLEYYKKAYNDDLTLKTFNGIKIIGFACGQDYDDIEKALS